MNMLLVTLFVGFLLGVVAVIAIEIGGFLYVLRRLSRRAEKEAKSSSPQSSRGLYSDPISSLDFLSYYDKQGVIWVLELERIPKSRLVDKGPGEKRKKKEILEVSPVRKYGKIKDHILVMSESDGSHTEIALKGCFISAVSATNLSSRKWAKRYPIIVENKTSVIYNGSKTIYLYLETSWEKESWCKALRLASCEDNTKLDWLAKLTMGFQSYLASLNTVYPSFMKPSIGFNTEPVDRSIKLDGSTSRVRHFLKKFSKKPSKSITENKLNLHSASSRGGRKINDKSFSSHDSVLASDTIKAGPTGRTVNFLVEENNDLLSSSNFTRSSSRGSASVISDAGSDDKFGCDEGTLCWNLLISRLFFDFKSNTQMKSLVQERIQRTLSNMRSPSYIGEITCINVDIGNLPPYVHGMRVLPSDMNEVCSLEIDVEYSGGAVLDIETRLEVGELDFQEGMGSINSDSRSMGEVTSDLLEGFEELGEELKLSDGVIDIAEQKSEEDIKHDGTKSSKKCGLASSYASRWKSVLNSIAMQVSQVPISLAIRVGSIRGIMRLYIKSPASDQIWFGFTSMPDIDFKLESSVGEHKIASGHIVMLLVSKFKAAIRDTLVHPNCESVCIPWMLAEKDDWVPRQVAPFIFINDGTISDPAPDPSPLSERPPSSDGGEGLMTPLIEPSTRRVTSLKEGGKHDNLPMKDNSSSYEPPTIHPTLNTKPIQQQKPSSSKNEEPTETSYPQSKEENPPGGQSPCRSLVLTEEQGHLVDDDDDARTKKIGTRARMLGFGKKMGEKLEEKRRNIEEKSKHIVERMRGPENRQ